MRSRPRLVLSLALAFPVLVACASALPAGPTAANIIEHYVRSTHADRLVAETSSMHLTGRIEVAGLKGTLDVYAAKPDKHLVRTELMGTGVEAYDGEIGWTSHPMMGTQVLDGVQLFSQQMQADYEARLMKPEDYDEVELLGVEDFEGRPCHKIRMVYRAPSEPDLAEATLAVRTSLNWFDVETGMLRGVSTTAPSPLGEMPVTNVVLEYGTFDGFTLPKKSTQTAMSQVVTITIDSFEADTVDPSTFDRPEGVKALLEP